MGLREWLTGADATTEEDSPRDGAFSYSGEWHAFFIGIAAGFASFTPSGEAKAFIYDAIEFDINGDMSRSRAMAEVRRESPYAFGGLVVGALLALLLQVLVLAVGVWTVQYGV